MRWIGAIAASLFAAVHASGAGAQADIPITGEPVPELAALDDAVAGFLAAQEIDGAAVAVAYQGRLVYARGFGHVDADHTEPVQPGSLFRIASVSKPITAMAVLSLVEDGLLSLDDRMVDVVGIEPSGEGSDRDERLGEITVRHLLEHTAGWDASRSGDPMFMLRRIARDAGVPSPPDPRTIVRWALARPLDFAPGERFAYSNFGYCVLGRIIEARTGEAYEAYVRRRILEPLGITRMRIGRTLASERAQGEVRYRDPGRHMGASVYDAHVGIVDSPYGMWSLEVMDANGGWIASAVDLVRIACALDGGGGAPLKAETVEELFAAPGYAPPGAPVYYARGWIVRRTPRGRNTWHNGALPGSGAMLVRLNSGVVWAALFNTEDTADGSFVADLSDPVINGVLVRVREWPEGDLFPRFLRR